MNISRMTANEVEATTQLSIVAEEAKQAMTGAGWSYFDQQIEAEGSRWRIFALRPGRSMPARLCAAIAASLLRLSARFADSDVSPHRRPFAGTFSLSYDEVITTIR